MVSSYLSEKIFEATQRIESLTFIVRYHKEYWDQHYILNLRSMPNLNILPYLWKIVSCSRCHPTSDTWLNKLSGSSSAPSRAGRTRSRAGRSPSTRWSLGSTTPCPSTSSRLTFSSSWSERDDSTHTSFGINKFKTLDDCFAHQNFTTLAFRPSDSKLLIKVKLNYWKRFEFVRWTSRGAVWSFPGLRPCSTRKFIRLYE